MKVYLMFLFILGCVSPLCAQQIVADSIPSGIVTVSKDPRIEILGKKMAEYNESLANKIHTTRGYRLMILRTNNRSYALQVRAQLLQLYPDEAIYMIFQSPFIKMKFGNFLDKKEAEDFRKMISQAKIVEGNIYIVPELVEVKADRLNIPEEQQ